MTEPLTDEQIEKIRAAVHSVADDISVKSYFVGQNFAALVDRLCAQALQANALRQQKWIAVGERAPDYAFRDHEGDTISRVVLVGNNVHGIAESACYHFPTKDWCRRASWWEVTHWQGLPAPPPAEQQPSVDSTAAPFDSAGQVQPSRAER